MFGVVDLGDTPRVDPSTNRLSVDFNLFLGADDGKGEESLNTQKTLRMIHRTEEMQTHSEFTVVLDRLFIILFHVIGKIINGDVIMLDVFHDLKENIRKHQASCNTAAHTLFLKPLSSLGVKESALPMTGITLTRGDNRRISSMSISRKLHIQISCLHDYTRKKKLTYA